MAGRRGFFAELNHQAQLRERERLRQAQAAHREWQAVIRRSEQAQRAAERAQVAAARTSAVEARAAEKENTRPYAQARTAEVEAANATLETTYAEIDSLLTATLDVDDWVDLESLRVTVEHPPFSPSPELVRPVQPPDPPRYPPVPVYQESQAPTGTAAMFGGRKRHDAALQQARANYAQACRAAQTQADAMQDSFPVSHEHRFDLSTRELVLTVRIPQPSAIPTVKQYRWAKAKDEIGSTALPVKEQKERYASAVCQVAVRSLHELFEADRAGRIHSIALTVCTGHLDPATGHPVDVPLAIVGTDRDTFSTFDLRNVVPSATLERLGASVSSKPAELVPADASRGVRTTRAR